MPGNFSITLSKSDFILQNVEVWLALDLGGAVVCYRIYDLSKVINIFKTF